nr:hypothetical protein [Tanacetum cinerariifolium]
MGSKEEAERIKRKGLSLEQESVNKQKTSEEVPEEAKSPDEVPKEKVKEMIQLVPIEEVYVEALQVKHPIMDWKKNFPLLVKKVATARKKEMPLLACIYGAFMSVNTNDIFTDDVFQILDVGRKIISKDNG